MIIRKCRTEDEAALYEICLRTGDDGRDASARYTDPMMPGHIFAGPYARLEPDFAFVLDDSGTVAGYVLGVPDTRAFEARCEREWWPALRARYPDPAAVPAADRSPDQRMAHAIHHPVPAPDAILRNHPSHLHIDLLPQAQGGGNGRRMVGRLLAALTAAGSPGVHLNVSHTNTSAIGFYRHLGFAELGADSHGLFMGRRLAPPGP